MESKWIRIAGTLCIGLFVAYIDRTNLSVALPELSQDLGIVGAQKSLVLTIFLIGYAISNVLGGIIFRKAEPKTIVVGTVLLWSLTTVLTGIIHSIALLLLFRLILGIAEGVYWPQQSRFAQSWFSVTELTRANSIIQYYGQFSALAIGFILLTPIYDMFGWRMLFFITGGVGLAIIVPLYLKMLGKENEAPYYKAHDTIVVKKEPLTLQSLGGWPFILVVFTYITQGMLFWGITLWIPMVAKSLGFSGVWQGIASALPYLMAIILAVPISYISDKTCKRELIASLGLFIPGVLLMLLPHVNSPLAKMGLITVAMGYYASSFTPNIWSIIQKNVKPSAVAPAAGIVNGLGAGGGGTIAGFLVGYLESVTGTYTLGFVVLGALVIVGGISLLLYGRFNSEKPKYAIGSPTDANKVKTV